MKFGTGELQGVVDMLMRISMTMQFHRSKGRTDIEVFGVDSRWHLYVHAVLNGELTGNDKSDRDYNVVVDSKILKESLSGIPSSSEKNVDIYFKNGKMIIKGRKTRIEMADLNVNSDNPGRYKDISKIRLIPTKLSPTFSCVLSHDERLESIRKFGAIRDSSNLVHLFFEESGLSIKNDRSSTLVSRSCNRISSKYESVEYMASCDWLTRLLKFGMKIPVTITCNDDLDEEDGKKIHGPLRINYSSDKFTIMCLLQYGNSLSRPVTAATRRYNKQVRREQKDIEDEMRKKQKIQ